MLRIIFLDVDGVLNNASEFMIRDRRGSRLTEDCINNLTLVELHADLIVLSSTWRLGGEASRHMQHLRKELRQYDMEIHSVTPATDGIRGNDILQWLEYNGFNCHDFKMVIIDDSSDFLDWQKPYLVQTSFEEGLTEAKAIEAADILKGEYKKITWK